MRPLLACAIVTVLPTAALAQDVDLVTQSLELVPPTMPRYLFVGWPATVEIGVGNGGRAPAEDFGVSVVLGGGANSSLARVAPLRLGASSSTVVLADIVVPPSAPRGPAQLLAIADDDAAITETDERNNLRGVPVIVSDPLPDLVPLEVLVSEPVVPAGGALSVTFVVVNAGVEPSLATDVRFELSVAGDPGPHLATVPLPPLGVGDRRSFMVALRVPVDTMLGDYVVLMRLDHAGVVTELDEANDRVSAPFAVDGPRLAIVTRALPGGQVGAAYDQRLRAVGPAGPPTWSLLDPPPPGLALSADGQLTGTPRAAGDFVLRAHAEASGAFDDRALRLTIAPLPPRITTTALADAVVGEAYFTSISVENGVPPYTLALESPGAPGLALAELALLGVPTTAGVYDLALLALDARGTAARRILRLVVQTPLAPPIIDTTALPPGRAGVAYCGATPVRLSARGGLPPLTWTLDEGPLPDGLALAGDGALCGTPATAGTFPLRVRVIDAVGATDVAVLSLEVAPAAVSDVPVRAPALETSDEAGCGCTTAPPGSLLSALAVGWLIARARRRRARSSAPRRISPSSARSRPTPGP